MDVIRGKTLGSDQGLIYFLRRASIAHGCSTMVAGIHDHEEKEDVDDQEEEDDVDDHEEEEDVDDHEEEDDVDDHEEKDDVDHH